ncbi:MAG: SH3 domain-containing protein [Intestinibacter sp.]
MNNTDGNSIQVAINDSELPEYNFYFELPLNGSTGYASIAMNMVKSPTSSTVVKKLSAGDGFRILEEDGNWWKVKTGETTGYVKINIV